MKNKMAIGLMSGTSADGLCVCAVTVRPFAILHFKNYPYPAALQNRLLNAFNAKAPALSALHFELGQLYAAKVKLFLKMFNINPTGIACAGSHGQTIYHGPNDPQPSTLQLGEPSFLAELLGCPVVSDFRPRDIALGGQGAPLMPFFDEFIWGQGSPKILLNIGGISNLAVTGKNIKTFGFDCGPGNTLMDLVCQRFLNKPYDKGGRLAAANEPDISLVKKLLQHPYFAQKPPKSLDKNQFGEAYLKHYFTRLSRQNAPEVLAALNYFTASAVAGSITRFVPKNQQKELIVSGGGAFNKTLLLNLQKCCPQLRVTTASACGIDPLAKESAAFAVMAFELINGRNNHCPRATGARKNAPLGKITL